MRPYRRAMMSPPETRADSKANKLICPAQAERVTKYTSQVGNDSADNYYTFIHLLINQLAGKKIT